MDDLLKVTLAALIFALVNQVGFSRLADLIVSLFDTVFGGSAYRGYKAKWSSLQQMRSELSSISAQDEFAKWARLQRRIDAAQADYDKESGERGRRQMGNKLKCSLVLRVVYYVALAWVYWRMGGSRVVLPVVRGFVGEREVRVLGRVFVGRDGSIPVTVLFGVLLRGLSAVTSLPF
jgi:hypothetical protein